MFEQLGASKLKSSKIMAPDALNLKLFGSTIYSPPWVDEGKSAKVDGSKNNSTIGYPERDNEQAFSGFRAQF
jgi:hypothetical protein